MFKKSVVAVGFISAFLLPAPSWALRFDGFGYFTTEFGGFSPATQEPGLVIDTFPEADLGAFGFGFDLNNGESTHQKIGTVWTNETRVDADDRVPQDLAAVFYLDGPTQEAGSVHGTVVGRSKSGTGQQSGQLIWDNPTKISWSDFSADPAYPPDWGVLTVALSGGEFNLGEVGLCPGQNCGALDIDATFTYNAPPAPVPLPPAVLLFLSALGGIGICARRAPAQEAHEGLLPSPS